MSNAVRTVCFGLLVAAVATGGAGTVVAQLKKPAEETVKGTLSEVEKKGKTAKITVKRDDGDDLELTITPKMRLAIEGTGDRECIRPNASVVECEAVLSNMNFFASTFKVYLGPGAPQVSVQRDPQGGERYNLCGLVTGADETGLMVNFGPQGGGIKRLLYDTDRPTTFTVVTSDVNFLDEEMEVELTGLMRAGKLLPSSIKATRTEGFKAEELFANPKTAAKAKAAAAKGAASKKTKEADGAIDTEADPFGVTTKKNTKTTKPGTKEAAPEAADPFSVGKKDGKGTEKPKDSPVEAADPFGVGKKKEEKKP